MSRLLKSWWRMIVVVMTPIVFLPIPIVLEDNAAKAAYSIAIISIFWLTEVVPIAITALLPLILFPALGVLSAEETSKTYLKDNNWLFVGGLMMAVAIEKWNLHKRMALLVLMAVGAMPKWLLFGFMGSTAFLSMWISNTATAAMMLPIAHAVLKEIKEENKMKKSSRANHETLPSVKYTRNYNSTVDSDSEVDTNFEDGKEESLDVRREDENTGSAGDVESGILIDKREKHGAIFKDDDEIGKDLKLDDAEEHDHSIGGATEERVEVTTITTRAAAAAKDTQDKSSDKSYAKLTKCLMLGVAYSANIGGTATLTGTGPNIVLSGLASDLGVNFARWFAFGAPAMLLALFCSWIYLSTLYCDDCFWWCKRRMFRQKQRSTLSGEGARKVIREQYKKLGRIRFAEILVLLMFLLLAILWLTREPRFIPGWGKIFETEESGKSYFSDATTALLIVFLLFVIPSEPCCCSNWIGAGSSPRLLDWNSVQHKLPWNVVILLGSGFALAEAAKQSHLSDWLGSQLRVLGTLPHPVIAFLVSVIMASVTEVMSNIATTTLFLPVLRDLAIELCINPLYLMIPATVSASYAFMIPVATPPNAIAFSYGYLKVYDMVLTGVLMNAICVGVVVITLNTIGTADRKSVV